MLRLGIFSGESSLHIEDYQGNPSLNINMDCYEETESPLKCRREVEYVFDEEGKFTDSTFPPNIDSLMILDDKISKLSDAKRNKWLDYTW